VLTIIKRGAEGGETVDSYWLQQEDGKIGERKHAYIRDMPWIFLY